jgi:hypothetical protein
MLFDSFASVFFVFIFLQCFRGGGSTSIFQRITGSLKRRISFPSLLSSGSIKVKQDTNYKSLNSLSIPLLSLILLSSKASFEYSPLNLQRISIRGPFFQGWLIRTVDHTQQLSCITIIGSFSKIDSNCYDEHYIYSAINYQNVTYSREYFPSPSTVTIQSATITDSLNIHFQIDNFGYFHFNQTDCIINFQFDDHYQIHLHAHNRLAWNHHHHHHHHQQQQQMKKIQKKQFSFKSAGPEGWLAYTNLLPCHYFIYSVGSKTSYTLKFADQIKVTDSSRDDDMISGASSHIEGNHGTFFPEGWMWTHAIAPNNTASFSCIAGKFVIGMLSPLSIVFYLRRNNGEIIVFRTTDLDQHRYCIDGKHRNVSLECSSFLKGNQIKLTITTRQPTASFHTVYVPTVHGFSNQPGCQECYTAIAKVILTTRKHELEEYEFPLTALEFGGSFLNAIFATK